MALRRRRRPPPLPPIVSDPRVMGASGEVPPPITTIAVTGPWSTDSLMLHLSQRMDAMSAAAALSFEACERLAHESDRRYEQRFMAQEHAVTLALTRVDKEFHEHLSSARQETLAALKASDTAIGKSETATEKRFESVNEFRKSLSDLSNTMMPRLEAEQRVNVNAEKISALESRFGERLGVIDSRLDRIAGAGSVEPTATTSIAALRQEIADLRRFQYEAQGSKAQVVEARANNGYLYAAAGVVMSLVIGALTLIGLMN